MLIYLLLLVTISNALCAPAGPPLDGPPVPPYRDQVHIPEKCDDVLAAKVCVNLMNAAKTLKLKSVEVTSAVINAVKSGKASAEEIYAAAKETLQKKVLTKKCEDFTNSNTCTMLRALAVKLKIGSANVEEFVVQAVLDGKDTAVELYKQVVEYYKTEIKSKTCEDFLTTAQCDKIKDVSKTLKLKTDEWNQAFVDGLVKAKTDGTELVTEVFNNIKDYAKNTKCEDLLNPTVCATLRSYASATKIAFPKIMDAVISSVIKGFKLGKGLMKAIYDVTDYFYDCEDVFDQSSCDRLKKVAGVIGVKASQIDEIVRKYIRQGIDLGSSLYKQVMKFLKDKVFCKINIFCKDDDLLLDEASDMPVAKSLAEINNLNDQYMLLEQTTFANGKDKYDDWKDLMTEESNDWHRINKRDIYDDLKAAFNKATGRMKVLVEKFLFMSKEHLNKIRNIVQNIIKSIMGKDKAKRYIDQIDQLMEPAEKEHMDALHTKAVSDIQKILQQM